MPPSKQFVNVRTRQTRLYANVSEDRLELLLDRLRTSIQKGTDWVGVSGAGFTTIASYVGLYESWAGSATQIGLLIITTIFGSIIAYRVAATCWALKKYHPMTNDEFLTALAEEEEDSERQNEKVKDASVQI